MANRKISAAHQEEITAGIARLKSVSASPAPAPEKPEKPKRAPRAPKAEQMPAEQKPHEWVRIPFMTDEDQRKALAAARLEDGIEATARLRAMVKLWMESPQYRRNVDKLAAADRSRDRRARGYRQ